MERAWRGTASGPDLVWRALEASSQPWLLSSTTSTTPRSWRPSGARGRCHRLGAATRTSLGMVLVTSRDRAARPGETGAGSPDEFAGARDGAAMLMEALG